MINKARQLVPAGCCESAAPALPGSIFLKQEALELCPVRLTRVWLMAFLCHTSTLAPYIFFLREWVRAPRDSVRVDAALLVAFQ